MPNPTGVNNFNHFAPEPAYGQKIQEQRLAQAAPLPPNPPMSAPRRAQRKATRGGGQAPAPPTPAPGPPPQVNPQITTASMWAAIAQTPGASPLVQSIARDAQNV